MSRLEGVVREGDVGGIHDVLDEEVERVGQVPHLSMIHTHPSTHTHTHMHTHAHAHAHACTCTRTHTVEGGERAHGYRGRVCACLFL